MEEKSDKTNSKIYPKAKTLKLISRIPWSDFQEWKNCYDFLFTNTYGISGKKIDKLTDTIDFFIDGLDLENLHKSFNILSIWNSRADNNTYMLSTLLLLEEIIKFINDTYTAYNLNDEKHILSQKIIRVTNLIIDDLKKKNKNIASNMFLVAKEIHLPEFIIEIRHICTHKHLPDLNTLIFTLKYLYYWTKVNYWDKQYDLFNREIKVKEKIFELVNVIDFKNEEEKKNYDYKNNFEKTGNFIKENLICGNYNFKFEISSLFEIVGLFVEKFTKYCVFSAKGKVYNEKIKEFIHLFDLVYSIEKDLFIILIYKFISEFILKKITLISLLETKRENSTENTREISGVYLIEENKNILKKFLFLICFLQRYFKNGNNISKTSSELIMSIEENKEKKFRSENKLNENDLNFPLVCNYVYDMLKFSQDFCMEIKEIFQMFCVNFNNFCAFYSSNKTTQGLPCYLGEEKNKILLKKKRLNVKDYSQVNTCASGSLIFTQLEKLSRNNNLEGIENDSINSELEKEILNFLVNEEIIIEDSKNSKKENKKLKKLEHKMGINISETCVILEI